MGKSIANPAFALDEELWFGEGTDVEAESRAAASLAAVGARIVGAKPFPLAARRLDELTRNTNTRIEQVVAVLESDPALSARLLRLVNSAGYGLKIRCTSVRHAAVLVGSRRLNQVATTAAILDLFDGNNERAVELLEHAAIVGSLCRYLAVHVGLPHDEMFTCGFLHDIGKLMLLDAERERYAELLSRYSGAPDQIHAEERRIFGFDHAVLGAHVLAAWNIPEPVPKVIAWHHFPARAMQDTVIAAMVQTLRLADLLSYVLALHDEKVGIEIVGNSEAARYLDVSGVQLSAMWQDLAGLRERSRARSHGEPELDVMVPKTEVPESMRPRSSRVSRLTTGPASRAARPLQEVPAHFPCSVCGKQSYGNVCAACGGHVCPEHQGPSDEWCSTCRREFVQFRRTAELSIWVKIGVGLLVGGTLAVGVVSAARSANAGIGSWVTGPLVVVALWAVVLPVAYQLWQKLRFLHGRRHFSAASGAPTARASVPMTVDESGGEGSLDFPEPEGLSDSSPALEIGPISTASLALSVAPRSMRPLSMAPVSTPPSANSSRLSAGSPSPVLDAAGRVEPLRSAAPSTVGDVAADSDVAALERAEDAGSLGPPTPAPHTLASSAELAPAPPLPEVVDPVAPTVLGATPPTISAIPQPMPSAAPSPIVSAIPQPMPSAAPSQVAAPPAAVQSPEVASAEANAPSSERPFESGSHRVIARFPLAAAPVNSALQLDRAVGCSAARFTGCVSGSVVLSQPLAAELEADVLSG